MDWVILVICIVATVFICDVLWFDTSEMILSLIVVCTIWAAWHYRDTAEETAAKSAATEAERVAKETPHVIREVDGCRVYEFYVQNRAQFFTRCPASTSTETNWTEKSGKTVVPKQSTIVTNNE